MSLTSLLLAFAPAIAARFEKKLEPYDRLLSRLDLLSEQLEALQGEHERMVVERDAERERAGLWRNEALRLRHNDLLPMPMGGQHALPQHPPPQTVWEQHNAIAQQALGGQYAAPSGINPQYAQQMQNAMAPQADPQLLQMAMAQNAHLAQQAQLLADGVHHGLGQLGQAAQNAWPEGWHCDCSPSRSRSLLGL